MKVEIYKNTGKLKMSMNSVRNDMLIKGLNTELTVNRREKKWLKYCADSIYLINQESAK